MCLELSWALPNVALAWRPKTSLTSLGTPDLLHHETLLAFNECVVTFLSLPLIPKKAFNMLEPSAEATNLLHQLPLIRSGAGSMHALLTGTFQNQPAV